ncbi:MAG: DUF4911 domain-containing protein [Desulfobulbaceae bacterium]|uniref:DUF4911 domain-containing protein n=1 Tax=Candidatus Desulfobia pelagia TaxID=2841692 RepID=A0A8J6NE35_9BACT|nr:DUF4911 domain-containing protein [Candidatus Desulfobia pelagia]
MQTKKLYLRINPAKIHFFKSILEGYEGLAMMSTLDGKQGLVSVRYSEEAQRDVLLLLEDLSPLLSKE